MAWIRTEDPRSLREMAKGFCEEKSPFELTKGFLATHADSIWGGNNDVQLSVIAKRMLQIRE